MYQLTSEVQAMRNIIPLCIKSAQVTLTLMPIQLSMYTKCSVVHNTRMRQHMQCATHAQNTLRFKIHTPLRLVNCS